MEFGLFPFFYQSFFQFYQLFLLENLSSPCLNSLLNFPNFLDIHPIAIILLLGLEERLLFEELVFILFSIFFGFLLLSF